MATIAEQPPAPRRHAAGVALLDVDPDLGALLDAVRRTDAREALRVAAHRLPTGPWDVSGLMRAGPEHVGLLVLDGVIVRELMIDDLTSAELLGPGDLLRPWQTCADAAVLHTTEAWSVFVPASVAILDRRVAVELTRWPEVTAVLLDRLAERSNRLATQQAISQLTRVDRRLRALFWQLADRWGQVTPDGVLVPLALSHRMLGRLVGAQRPTISTALSGLADRGELVRRPDGGWLLRGEPPHLDGAATAEPLAALLR